MNDIGHNSDAADMNPQTAAQLKAIVERIETVEAQIKDLNADKSEIYHEAKGNGFDVKIIKKVVAVRRVPEHERSQEEQLVDLYLSAVGTRE